MASGSDLFCDTVFQNYFLHAKASPYTHKRNHFTQFTFIHHLSIKQSFFFWASYSRFFHFHYSEEGFEWFISQCLDSIRAHKQQMGSCSSDWRWNGCIWFMIDIIYKCYVNYHCCRCHCFLSLLYTQKYFFLVYISEYHFTRPGKQKNTKSLHLLLSEILFQEKKFFQQKCIIFIFTLNKDTITLQ